jgi:hypothetical protein
MFKIFADGDDDRLRLEDSAGRKVGWIRGHTIGFDGLASEKAALQAAVEAWPSLETTLHREFPGRVKRPVNTANIDLTRDGGSEWVADGPRPLARLLRPLTGRNAEDSFALEFFVPSYATQHVTIAAAQAVGEVLSKYKPAAAKSSPVRAK